MQTVWSLHPVRRVFREITLRLLEITCDYLRFWQALTWPAVSCVKFTHPKRMLLPRYIPNRDLPHLAAHDTIRPNQYSLLEFARISEPHCPLSIITLILSDFRVATALRNGWQRVRRGSSTFSVE